MGAAVAVTWVLVAPVFDRDFFTTPGGSAPVASGGVGSSALDMPATFASYLWQQFLPRLPFMNDQHIQDWPAFEIYVKRAWGAFGWYAVYFPNWVYRVIVGVMLAVGIGGAVAVGRRILADRPLVVEALVLFLMVAGVVVGVAAAYFTRVGHREGVFEQGRYAFTAIAPLAAAVAAAVPCSARGAFRLLPPVFLALVAATAGLYIASGWLALSQFYA